MGQFCRDKLDQQPKWNNPRDQEPALGMRQQWAPAPPHAAAECSQAISAALKEPISADRRAM